MDPLIIEVAINGPAHPWKKQYNPHFPVLPHEVAGDAIACLDAGASVIHSHIDQNLSGAEAAARYAEGYRPILHAHPDAILCPSVSATSQTTDIDLTGEAGERSSHFATLTAGGLAHER